MIDMIRHAERASELLRTLSHPYRLLVLCALRDGERSVGELQSELHAGQVALSQQLMRLRADGLVSNRKEGTQVFYQIAKPEVLDVLKALHHVLCHNAQTEGMTSDAAEVVS